MIISSKKMNKKVKWLDWNKSVFEKSKREKKPILLSISAVWCHWCHNMDNLAYSNKEIISLINKNFVAVRVDTDKRPDVNESYNMGGWPTTAVLSPQGELLTGATYITAEEMPNFLKRGIDRFNEQRNTQKHTQITPKIPEKITPLNSFIDSIIYSFYDQINAGFGWEPKFPHFEILEYLFNHEKYRDILLKTLQAMAESALQDKEAGGFYRYCTQKNWTIPHYEKMLEDNAKHLIMHLKAYEITKEAKYKQVAENTIRFLLTTLFDKKNSTFYGSQDADEAYCSLSMNEREKSKPPYVDKTIYTDWNATTAKAFIKAYSVLNNKEYLKIAFNNIDFLLAKCYKRAAIHHPDSEVALLRDNVCLLSALLCAYEAKKNKRYLDYAEKITKSIEKKFYDKKYGAFFSTSKKGIGELSTRKKQISENSLLCIELMRFDKIIKTKHLRIIEKTLLFFNNYAMNYGFMAATYALAVDKFLESKVFKDIPSTKNTATAPSYSGQV